jgi:hypothetical protein
MLRYCLSIPSFLRAFIMLDLVEGFSSIYWDDKMVLSLLLLMWCITFIDLHMLNHICFTGMKPTWSRGIIFLMCCWIWLAIILLKIFAWCSLSRLACSLPFWRCLCLLLEWV